MNIYQINTIRNAIFTALISLSFFSHNSFASAVTACEDVAKVTKNVDTSTCFQFVTGFLEGALLSDEQIMTNLGSSKELSDFAKRAMRTRVGQQQKVLPSTVLADFCLPDTTVSDDVVLNILESLKQVEDKSTISSTMIYSIIKREYPCV